MDQIVQVLLLVIGGALLLWLGYHLFFGFKLQKTPANYPSEPVRNFPHRRRISARPKGIGYPGASRTCPICCSVLDNGEVIKTKAFPSLNGGKDRFMHIQGCVYCLMGSLDRVCPVCGHILNDDEFLICRMYEHFQKRKLSRPHVHVMGCSKCRGS